MIQPRSLIVLGASLLVLAGVHSARSDANPPTLTLELGGGILWEGVLIPAGTFVMGSPPGEARTEAESTLERQHKVTLTRPFYMGKYEITQTQYEQIVRANPSR